MPSSIPLRRSVLSVSIGILLAAAPGRAADVTWTNGANNLLWNTSSLNFTAGGYTLSGTNALTFVRGGSSTLAGRTISVATGTATIDAPVVSTVGLEVFGAGTLRLSNSANSFSGAVPVANTGRTIQRDTSTQYKEYKIQRDRSFIAHSPTPVYVTADGTQVVGSYSSTDDKPHYFRWKSGAGVSDIPESELPDELVPEGTGGFRVTKTFAAYMKEGKPKFICELRGCSRYMKITFGG